MLERPSPEPERRYVFLIDLAVYLGRTVCGVQGKAQRLGCHMEYVRRPESGKAALAVSPEDAKRIIAADIKPADIMKPEDL